MCFSFSHTIHLLMDTEDNHDFLANVHSQDEQDDSQRTIPDTNTNICRSIVPTDCAVSVDILSRVSDDYQIVHNIKYEVEQEYNIKCHREGDSGGVSEIRCLQSVKIEDEVQQSNDQQSIEPFNYSTQISTAINGVNTFVDVKQESKLDIGVRSRSSEDTRHWIVCSGNVLKEVKAEQTVSKSVTECGEDLYEKQQQCRIHNAEETETNWIHVRSSASGLSLTQSSQREPDEDANNLACDTCGTSCIMSGILEMNTHFHRRVKTYQCQLRTAWRASQCERNVPEKLLTSVKHFACSTCGKSFARGEHLREHERIHSGVKPFTCTLCGKSFTQEGNLRCHERLHSGVKPFTCSLCGKSFARARSLTEHERIHSGVKPFRCTMCGKSFAQSGSLKSHERIHSGVKSFTGSLCGKSFARARSLTEHERIHSGVKPFTCILCGKSFSQMGNLRVHERLHSCVKPFTCAL